MRTGTGPETTSRSPLITSKAWQSRFNGRGEKVLFRETEATKLVGQDGRSQRVGFETALSLMRSLTTRRRCAWLDGS
jgi:hypothetical protein